MDIANHFCLLHALADSGGRGCSYAMHIDVFAHISEKEFDSHILYFQVSERLRLRTTGVLWESCSSTM
jgi:hypothetical protein